MLLPEIFHKISTQVTPTRKKDLLIKLQSSVHSQALMTVLILIYDWSLEFRVPDGTPSGIKLNRVPPGTDHTVLRTEYTKLYNFIVGGNDNLSQLKVESIYVEMLENLHHTEADFLLRIFNRAMFKDWGNEKRYKIPFKVVADAYPDIKWFCRGKGVEPERFDPFLGMDTDNSETEETIENVEIKKEVV